MQTFKDELAALQGKRKAEQAAQRKDERLRRKEAIQGRRIEGLIGLHEVADADKAGQLFTQAAKAIRRRNEWARLDRYLAAIDGGPSHYEDERRAIVKLVVAAYDGDTPADIGQMYLGYRSIFLPGRFLSATARFVEDFRNRAPAKTAEPIEPTPPKPVASSKCGPEPPSHFRQGATLHELEISPAPWKMLCAIWGKASIAIPDLAQALGKRRSTKYATLKPTVTRLIQALQRAGVKGIWWTKKRGENTLVYHGPPLPSSVST